MSQAARDYSAVLRRPSRTDLARRLPQAIAGMLALGISTALSLRADLGASPWDVFHQGIARRTGWPFGAVVVGVGAVVMVAWIPLHQRFGLVSLINVAMVGPAAGVALDHLGAPSAMATRVLYLAAATIGFGVGAGLYIGAALGPGPRDGLMTALTARGLSVWKVRMALEVSILIVGWALGGTVGAGTVVLAFACGPITHVALARFHVPLSVRIGVHGE